MIRIIQYRLIWGGLVLWLALTPIGGRAAHAQGSPDPPSPAHQAVALRDESLGALQAGDDDQALDLATRALALDTSNLTLKARQVQVEVLLKRGALDQARSVLLTYRAVPMLPEGSRAWLDRADMRLAAEVALNWADVGAARDVISALEGVDADELEPGEVAWMARARWRVEIREPEAARDIPRLRSSLAQARTRSGLDAHDLVWLDATSARAEVLEAEQACDSAKARGALEAMTSLPGLSEPDKRWVRLAGLRLDLRDLDAAGRGDEALRRLDEISRLGGLSTSEQRWILGYRAQLELKAALATGDKARIAELRPVYEAWVPWEPPCSRLDLAAGGPARARAPTWVRLGVLGGAEGWWARESVWEGDAPDPDSKNNAPLEQDPVVGASSGVSAEGAWGLTGPLALTGAVRIGVPFVPRVLGTDTVYPSRWSIDGALGLSVSVGPIAVSLEGVTARQRLSGVNGEALTSDATPFALPVGSVTWTPTSLAGTFELQASGGGLPGVWFTGAGLQYLMDTAPWRPTMGVVARCFRRAQSLTSEGKGAAVLNTYGVDGYISLNVGMEWRK